MACDTIHKKETRHEALSLANKLKCNDIVFMFIVWTSILERVHATSKSLQSVESNLDLIIAVNLYASLEQYMETLRNDKFEEFYQKVPQLTGKPWLENEPIKRKRKRFFDEANSEETVFNTKETLKNTLYNVILDSLISELSSRKSAYKDLHAKFGFLLELEVTENNIIEIAARKLIEFYPMDLNDELVSECKQLKEFLKFNNLSKPETNIVVFDLLKMLNEKSLILAFPNVYTALKIFLTIPIANTTSERSFSALKQIKNYLRSTLGQENLQQMAIIAIENDVAKVIDADNILDLFTILKNRRKII